MNEAVSDSAHRPLQPRACGGPGHDRKLPAGASRIRQLREVMQAEPQQLWSAACKGTSCPSPWSQA